jgi:hypothetical protein
MKKLAIIGILGVVLGIGGLFAVDLTKYPSAVPANSWTLDLGIGFNSPAHGDLKLPPISFSADYALPIGGLPFFVGGIAGIYMSGYDNNYVNYEQKWRYTVLDIGGRFGYHFNWDVDKLDTYALVTLGLDMRFAKVETKWSGHSESASDSDTDLFWGFAIGGRYFFTPNIGAFLELGYSALSFATLGVTFHF